MYNNAHKIYKQRHIKFLRLILKKSSLNVAVNRFLTHRLKQETMEKKYRFELDFLLRLH